jgi:hypothetical protein
MKNVTFKRWFTIPIYRCEVLLVVAEDAVAACKRYKKTFDLAAVDDDFRAYCVYGNGYFGLFFQAALLDNNSIAHEIKHLVNFIKEHIGDTPCCKEKSDEHDAYLSGYVTERVYGLLKKNKITVHND